MKKKKNIYIYIYLKSLSTNEKEKHVISLIIAIYPHFFLCLYFDILVS